MPADLPAPDELESKGFTLRSALAYVEHEWGEEGVARVQAASAEEDRAILEGRILPSSWYPFGVQVRLYETIDRLFGDGDLGLCWEIGKFTSQFEMKLIHKAFLRVAGLDLWVQTAGLMWGRYYNRGRLEVEDIGATSGVVRVSEFNPLSKAFCYDFGGWLHRTVELAGYTAVRIEHRECRLDGAETCRYLGRWETS